MRPWHLRMEKLWNGNTARAVFWLRCFLKQRRYQTAMPPWYQITLLLTLSPWTASKISMKVYIICSSHGPISYISTSGWFQIIQIPSNICICQKKKPHSTIDHPVDVISMICRPNGFGFENYIDRLGMSQLSTTFNIHFVIWPKEKCHGKKDLATNQLDPFDTSCITCCFVINHLESPFLNPPNATVFEWLSDLRAAGLASNTSETQKVLIP